MVIIQFSKRTQKDPSVALKSFAQSFKSDKFFVAINRKYKKEPF